MDEKQSIIWSSGHYLTNHLPDDYDKWEEDKLDDFLESNAWEPFQYYMAEDIWDFITSMANSVREIT